MSVKDNFPNLKPSLLLAFSDTKTLDPRITYARASTATYYDDNTTAKAEENLFLYSQEFDNAAWLKAGATVTANSTTAPDGTNTADAITGDGTLNWHGVRQAISSGTVTTASVFVKANTANFVQISYSGDVTSYANYDVSSGSVTAAVGTVTATISSVGGGWYRCVAVNTSTSQSHVYISVISNGSDGRLINTTLTSGIYIWGAQLEQRSQATAYQATTTQPITNYIPVLQTAAAGVPRFDHNPVTSESLGFLVEEQRTNLLTYSEDFANAVWVKNRSSVEANTIVAPDGTLTGDKHIPNNTSGVHVLRRTFTFSSSTTYTLSCYAKRAEQSFIRAECFISGVGGATLYINLATGAATTSASVWTINSALSVEVGNGWFRCFITFTVGATGGAGTVDIGGTTGSGTFSYTGNGYSGIYIWGAQLESSSFSTSYIKTEASQVTRSSDVASMTGTNFSSWYRQDEGTLYGEAAPMSVANTDFTVASINNASNNNRFLIGHYGVAPYETVISSGVVSANINSNYSSASVGSFYKAVGAAKANDFAISAQGTSPATDTLGAMPVTLTQLEIGKSVNDRYFNGTIKKIAYYPIRCSNAQLQALTQG